MKEDNRSIEQLMDDARKRCEEDAAIGCIKSYTALKDFYGGIDPVDAQYYLTLKRDRVAFDNKVESSMQGARRSAQMQLDDHYVFYADKNTKQMIGRLKRGSFSRATPTSKGGTLPRKLERSIDVGRGNIEPILHYVASPPVWRNNSCTEVALDIETGFQNFLAKQNTIYPVTLTTPKKENTMSIIDAKILVNLAQADANDEFTENMATMPAALREAIEEQRKQESKEAMQKAAKLIIQIYKDADVAIRDDVQAIRNARLMEQQAKERIANIQRAKAYAEATNNYLPLASLLGGLQVDSNVDQSKLVIPEDWVAPEEKAEAPVAAKKTAAKK